MKRETNRKIRVAFPESVPIHLIVYGYILFFRHFTKGNNFPGFLFASMDNLALLIWGPLLMKEKHHSDGSKLFPLRFGTRSCFLRFLQGGVELGYIYIFIACLIL